MSNGAVQADPIRAGKGRLLPAVPPLLAGRYRFIRYLGKGGSGVVYQARDQILGLDVAIKLFGQNGFEDKEVWERIKRETLAGRGIRHSAVARFRDLGQDGDFLFLVMDLIEGLSLNEFLQDQPLPPVRALALAMDILEGLRAIHEAGIIHRDLKPRNIMVSPEGHAVITDFGLARPVSDRSLTHSNQIVGTPLCIAPEQWLGKPADQRSDIYAFGITLYALLFGVPPFHAKTDFGYLICHLNKAISFPREQRKRVPPFLLAIVMRCLEKKPEQRYQSTEEVLHDLQRRQPPPRKSLWKTVIPYFKKPSFAVVLSALSLLALLTLWGTKPAGSQWQPQEAQRPLTLAVLRFLAPPPTGKDDLQLWGGGITDLLGADLGQSGRINLIPDTAIVHFLNKHKLGQSSGYRAEDLKAFLSEYPVEYLVSGSLTTQGEQVMVSLFIHQGSSGKTIHTTHFATSPREGYFRLVDRMSEDIQNVLNLPSRQEREGNRPIEDIRTRSTPALLAFQKGKDAFLEQRFEEARTFLKESLVHDSEFAQAHFLLSMVASYSGSWSESRSHANSALKLVNRLTPRDAFLITAWKARHVDRDISEAARILTLMHQRYPLDEEGRNLLAAVLRDLGHFQDARRILTSARFRTREYLGQAQRNLLFLAYLEDHKSEFRKRVVLLRQDQDPFADHLQFSWNLRHGEMKEALDTLDFWKGSPEEKENRKALLYLAMDEPQRAWTFLGLNPESAQPQPEKMFLGVLIMMAQGKIDRALTLLRKIPPQSGLAPHSGFSNYMARILQARCLEIQGRKKETLELLHMPTPGINPAYLHRLWLIRLERETGQNQAYDELMQEKPEQTGWLTRAAQEMAKATTQTGMARMDSLRLAARHLPAEHTRFDLHALRLLMLLEMPSLEDDERVDLTLQFMSLRQSRLLWCDRLIPLLSQAAPLALERHRHQEAQTLLTLLTKVASQHVNGLPIADWARKLLGSLPPQG